MDRFHLVLANIGGAVASFLLLPKISPIGD